jgi:hypothetical protein
MEVENNPFNSPLTNLSPESTLKSRNQGVLIGEGVRGLSFWFNLKDLISIAVSTLNCAGFRIER